MSDIITILSGNTYPGRGILLGRSSCGEKAVIAYFIMGRSVNSRNRVFVADGEGLRTQAFDPAKLSDPSLVIYSPVRLVNGCLIVTNGDQTDTIYDFLHAGRSFEDALRTRTFEPDPPILTPRVSGLIDLKTGAYKLSILKSADGNPGSAERFFYEYPEPLPARAHLIHTYEHDGNPVPSFRGEPRTVEVAGDADTLAEGIWEALDADNRVSLFVRTVHLKSGQTDTRVINRHIRPL